MGLLSVCSNFIHLFLSASFCFCQCSFLSFVFLSTHVFLTQYHVVLQSPICPPTSSTPFPCASYLSSPTFSVPQILWPPPATYPFHAADWCSWLSQCDACCTKTSRYGLLFMMTQCRSDELRFQTEI